MEQYVGLDVSLKETSICVVDGSGEIVCETSVGVKSLADPMPHIILAKEANTMHRIRPYIWQS